MPPKSPDDYRQRAEACEQLAATTDSPHVRETMIYVTSRWRELADEEEARGRPPEAPGPRPSHPSE